MNVCDVCSVEVGPGECKRCRYGNPCYGCEDYDEVNAVCLSDGACGSAEKRKCESEQ